MTPSACNRALSILPRAVLLSRGSHGVPFQFTVPAGSENPGQGWSTGCSMKAPRFHPARRESRLPERPDRPARLADRWLALDILRSMGMQPVRTRAIPKPRPRQGDAIPRTVA